VLYVIANSVPMLGLTIVGRDASTTVIGGAQHLWDNDQKVVGALVFFTAVVAPALQISLMLAVVVGGMRERPPRWVGARFRAGIVPKYNIRSRRIAVFTLQLVLSGR
jgi:paraquat-inducible protein A